MARISTFPQVIYVTVEEDGQNDWLSANLSTHASVGDSDKAIVGTYQFVNARELSKGPLLSKPRKTRKTS